MPTPDAPLRPPSRAHVLIVEDEPRMRELLQRVLPEWGFVVTVARSAEEAMRAVGDAAPDVIILDLNLPGEGGLAFFGRARERWPRVQGIVLTGFGSIAAAREAIRLEVIEFLTKPCHLGELEQAMSRALRRLSTFGAAMPSASNQVPELPRSTERRIPTDAPAGAMGKTLEEVERQHILATLAHVGGNRTAASAALGISRRTLYYKLDEYQKQGFLPE